MATRGLQNDLLAEEPRIACLVPGGSAGLDCADDPDVFLPDHEGRDFPGFRGVGRHSSAGSAGAASAAEEQNYPR